MSSGEAMDRDSLVTWLKRNGYIKSSRVEDAFRSVNREQFVLPEHEGSAYHDSPLPILEGQTISAPSMIAIMLEVAELYPGISVLEIGCGSGYNSALIAEIVGEDHVVTIERIPQLAEWGKHNLESAGYTITVTVGDGTLGYDKKAPYDRIISTAAAPKIPQPWIDQLNNEGLIICPVGSRHWYQELQVIRKKEDGNLNISYHGGCAFVPLIGKEGFRQ
jgi:protein-L-isoaspartate(D-aspartate) O-methyltransferase